MSVLEQLQNTLEQAKARYEAGGKINTLEYQMNGYAYSFLVYLSEQGLIIDYDESNLSIVDEVFAQVVDLPQASFERWINMVAGYVGLVMQHHLNGEWTHVADANDQGHVAIAIDGNYILLVEDLKQCCKQGKSIIDYYNELKENIQS